MDDNTLNTGNTNWTPPNVNAPSGQELPGANASFIMGIVGLVLSLCTGCGIIGFIVSIVAFSKGRSAIEMADANPGVYTEKSVGQAKTGKLLGLIGLILGVIVIVLLIVYFVIMGAGVINGNYK